VGGERVAVVDRVRHSSGDLNALEGGGEHVPQTW
jgi:hypothetical protein